VASPAFLARHKVKSLKELASLQLLSVEGVDWTWTTWADFLRETGAATRKLNVRRFNSYVIALQAAQDGQGVALGWQSLVAPLIAKRKLVQVTEARMAAPQSFFVTWSPKRPLSAKADPANGCCARPLDQLIPAPPLPLEFGPVRRLCRRTHRGCHGRNTRTPQAAFPGRRGGGRETPGARATPVVPSPPWCARFPSTRWCRTRRSS
jgi:hypothetical protein